MSAQPLKTIFLDDGGVMNDNSLREPQWQKLVGEFCSPRLGGTPERWGEANSTDLEQKFLVIEAGPGDQPLLDWWAGLEVMWLRDMAAQVGVDAPAPDEDCLALARECASYVMVRLRSAFPGAIDTVRRLHRLGYVLYTASSGMSWELEWYLEGMGLTGLFSELYGADLLGVMKQSDEYYRRLFERSGVEPAQAIVVDDSEQNLDYASGFGARTFLVSATGMAGNPRHTVVTGLSRLPDALGHPAGD